MSSSSDEGLQFIQEISKYFLRFVGELSLIQLDGVLPNIFICAIISFLVYYFLANSRRKDQSISSRRKWILYGLFISFLLLSSGIYFSCETFTRNRKYGKNYYELLEIPKFKAVDSKSINKDIADRLDLVRSAVIPYHQRLAVALLRPRPHLQVAPHRDAG